MTARNGLSGLFDRNGHLTELGLDRLALEADMLPAEVIASAHNHLDGCALCRAARDALADDDASFAIGPRPLPEAEPAEVEPAVASNVIAFPTRDTAQRAATGRKATARIGAAVVGFLALAAGLVIATRAPMPADDDSLRLKGNSHFSFNIWIHDGHSPTMATRNGFPVRPGDRMGFVITNDTPGHLLVLGRDDSGQRYTCFPQDGSEPATAAALEGHHTPFVLPAAMAFDAVLGQEHVAAIFCDNTFNSTDLPPDPCAAARLGTLPVRGETCAIRCLTLAKSPAPLTPEAP